ncbi:hypothetical protein GGC63_002608 [Paenibacillus sp. OAS669]|nr:hypothetical protein [Paenibacillus sp. OAS669]
MIWLQVFPSTNHRKPCYDWIRIPELDKMRTFLKTICNFFAVSLVYNLEVLVLLDT